MQPDSYLLDFTQQTSRLLLNTIPFPVYRKLLVHARRNTLAGSDIQTRTMQKQNCQQSENLDFDDVDRIPASFDFVGAVASLLDQDDACKAMVKVPQVHRRNAALKVPGSYITDRLVGHQLMIQTMAYAKCQSFLWYIALLFSTMSSDIL